LPDGVAFADDFEGTGLDRSVWIPHYLPMWSSRAESAATFEVAESELRLTIPVDQGLWCEGDHDPPLRVSGIQSAVRSGPVESTFGQQAYREGLRVREEQETHLGWTPHHGRIEVRARMELSPRSMASVWMVGLEDEPSRCGEICIFEVFGDAPQNVGMGTKRIRDPSLAGDFDAPFLDVDVSEPHDYAVEWQPGRVSFFVDGAHRRTVDEAPEYPVQMMIGVFDFPAHARAAESSGHVPMLAVDRVAQTRTRRV
jgi:hypothetical protein